MAERTWFVPPNLHIKKWKNIEPYFDSILRAKPKTLRGIRELMQHYSDALSVFNENDAQVSITHWRDMDKRDPKIKFNTFSEEIQPPFERKTNAIDRRIVDLPSFDKLRGDPEFTNIHKTFLEAVETQCDANIPLETEIQKVADRCEEILCDLAIKIDGKTYTIDEAIEAMKTNDREKREAIWFAIQKERMRVRDELSGYFDLMVQWRHKTGRRAGHHNYRKYEHYGFYPQHSTEDAAKFHAAMKKYAKPLARKIIKRRRRRLGLEGKMLRPWDTDSARWGFMGIPEDLEVTMPFKSPHDLLQKTKGIMDNIAPEFGDNTRLMEEKDLLDLAPRLNKATGAWTWSFEVQGLPFIGMHATRTFDDLATLVHELGHSMHVFETKDKPIIFNRFFGADYTLAETFSLGMELLSAPHWKNITDEKEALRARREHLEGSIIFLTWCPLIDKFQQQIYASPYINAHERDELFADLHKTYSPEGINWKGLEQYRKTYWQRVSHVFSTPFYYIQYGFAQLAAIELYKHYKEHPEETVQKFMHGMSLGATKPYPQVWKEMGLTLDFSPKGIDASLQKIPALLGFVMQEIEDIDRQIGDVSNKKGSH